MGLTVRKYFKLTHERLIDVICYDEKTGIFTWKKPSKNGPARPGSLAGNRKRDYASVTIDTEAFRAHRLAWFYVYGVWPDYIDHINGIKTDNRLENLRSVSNSVNMQNLKVARADSKTGLLGATPKGKRFVATIALRGKKWQIGIFDTAQEAHEAYLIEKRKVHVGCTI